MRQDSTARLARHSRVQASPKDNGKYFCATHVLKMDGKGRDEERRPAGLCPSRRFRQYRRQIASEEPTETLVTGVSFWEENGVPQTACLSCLARAALPF